MITFMVISWTSGESPLCAFGLPGHKGGSQKSALLHSSNHGFCNGQVKILGFRLDRYLNSLTGSEAVSESVHPVYQVKH